MHSLNVCVQHISPAVTRHGGLRISILPLQTYVESMMETPNSGFALYGLADSLRSLNRTQDAAQIEEVYKKAWENADGPLDSSCPSFSKMMSPALSRGGRKLLA